MADLGDPTEGALIVAAKKAGIERESDRTIVHEIPFDSKRKLMSVVAKDSQLRLVIYTKGAPELLLERCAFEHRDGKILPLSQERRERVLHQGREMAKRALRLLAFAYRNLEDDSLEYREEDLVFAGLVGMIDPPREEARTAVAKCQSAGIRPVIITGDHPATALAIAQELKIANQPYTKITGLELDALSDNQLLGKVENIAVYARVSPEHKLRVVEALKATGQVVAMTGDGVNDAPAVKMADIGIAMGITGTDVTKEVSDMVLTDDNFASIVNAVEEGRGIYNIIQEFVHYLLSCNISEVALVLFAAVVGWPVPLLPIQILWINLITDGLPALALAMEKPDPDVMSRRPRPPTEPFFTRQRGSQILIHGFIMATVNIGGFAYAYATEGNFVRTGGDFLHHNVRPAFFLVCLPQSPLHASATGCLHKSVPLRGDWNVWTFAALSTLVSVNARRILQNCAAIRIRLVGDLSAGSCSSVLGGDGKNCPRSICEGTRQWPSHDDG